MPTTMDRRSPPALTAAGDAAGGPAGAQAQDVPNQPITQIVLLPAGGSADRSMHARADLAGQPIGQP